MGWLELLDKLKSKFGISGDPVDRRRHYRVKHRGGVWATSKWDSGRHELTVVDVGPGGVRVESKSELMRSTEYDLLTPTSKMRPTGLQGEVVWGRKIDKNLWSYGVQFVVEKQQQRIAVAKFLLEECKLGIMAPEEKRKYMRVPVHPDVGGMLFVMDGRKLPVKVRDLAVTGALLRCERQVEPGTPVTARIALLPKQPEVDLEGKVVRQTQVPDSNEYELGVSFTKVEHNYVDKLKTFLALTLISN